MKNLQQFREYAAAVSGLGYSPETKKSKSKDHKLKKGTTLKIMPKVPDSPDKALGIKEDTRSCGEGQYYCHDMKKCKPIPKGMKVGKDGMLVKEENVTEASLAQAKRNIGRDPKKKTCWKGYRAKGTKMKDGRAVPNCVPEEAPPGKKYERMVKHIKRSYAKDGGLTKDEKSIAYATAWKHKNKNK